MLAERLHLPAIEALATQVAADEALFSDYVALLTDPDARTAYNAAWVLTRCPRSARTQLLARREKVTDLLLSTSNASMQRLLLTLLEPLPYAADDVRTDLLDFCLSKLTDGGSPHAVRALSMKLAEKLCRPFPELCEELTATLELLSPDELSPALRSSRRHVLKKMGKRFSAQGT